LLTGLKKLKGIDARPWRNEDEEIAQMSEEDREARLAQRAADNVSNMLAQLFGGRRQLYGKMMRDAETTFKAIDQDGNGSLDKAEFSTALKRLGLGATADQMKMLFKAMDVDKDGFISCEEFVSYLQGAAKRRKQEAKPSASRACWVPEVATDDVADASHHENVTTQLFVQSLQSAPNVFCNARALVVELLDNGADGLMANEQGETALCKAVAGGSWPFARELISRHGASELMLLAARQRLAWAQVLATPESIWGKRKKLAVRVTKLLETVGEPSQVMTVGRAQTLTTLSLMSLPDWVAQCNDPEGAAARKQTGSTVTGASNAARRAAQPRYMHTTAALDRRYNKNPGGQSEGSSKGSKAVKPFLRAHESEKHPLKSARELAIKLHHPMPVDSTARAQKMAADLKARGGPVPLIAPDSPHQRPIEDVWSIHSKVRLLLSIASHQP
jgi:hypothetical protein